MVINAGQDSSGQEGSALGTGPGARVLAGNPTEAEVAAVVAALGTAAGAGVGSGAGDPGPAEDSWSGYWRVIRTAALSPARD